MEMTPNVGSVLLPEGLRKDSTDTLRLRCTGSPASQCGPNGYNIITCVGDRVPVEIVQQGRGSCQQPGPRQTQHHPLHCHRARLLGWSSLDSDMLNRRCRRPSQHLVAGRLHHETRRRNARHTPCWARQSEHPLLAVWGSPLRLRVPHTSIRSCRAWCGRSAVLRTAPLTVAVSGPLRFWVRMGSAEGSPVGESDATIHQDSPCVGRTLTVPKVARSGGGHSLKRLLEVGAG